MYVYFYLFTRAGLARLDAALAGGRGLARRRARRGRFGAVTLPLLRPALAGAALLTFMTVARLVLRALPLRRRASG